MRFEALRLTNYGPLAARTFDLSADAIVVYGPNEAGKSSFHGALETALFGFDPGRRDRHPLGRWDPDGPGPALAARMRPQDGEPFWIRRELLRATSACQRGPSDGGWDERPRAADAPLVEVEAVTRDLYRAVYSLTAGGAIELKDSVRDQVDSLLCGELGLPGARPLHEVRAELEKEAARLWRRDRHRTQARDLGERIAELRATRRRAAAQDRGRRDERRELDRIGAELDETRQDLARTRRARDEAQFHAALRETEALRADCIPLRAAALEGESLEDPRLLQHEVDRLEADMEGPRARLARPPVLVSEREHQILRCAADIRLAVHETTTSRLDRDRLEAAETALRQHATEARRALVDAGLADVEPGELEDLPLGAWTADARAWQDAVAPGGLLGQRGQYGHASQAPPAGIRPPLPLAALALSASGLGLAALSTAGYLPGESLLAGILLLVFAVVAALQAVRPRALAEDRIFAAPGSAAAFASTLDVPAPHAPHAWLRQLEAAALAREAADLAADAGQSAAECRDRERARHAHWRDLADRLLEDGAEGRDPACLPESLQEALDAALHREHLAREDAAERSGQEARLDERSRRHAAACRRLRRVARALSETFGDDLSAAQAYRAWHEQLELQSELRAAEKRMHSDPLWPEFGPAVTFGDEPASGVPAAQEPAVLTSRVEELEARERELIGVHARLAERVTHRQGPSVAEVDGDLIAAGQQREQVHLEHDRRALLAHLLQLAEQRYRSEHQPDVLERAGRYLAAISAGRYTRLVYPEGDEGPLHVESAQLGRSIPVDAPLSRGIQEQVYLCLRLGTLDHLDAGRARLPLVLDEALIHWDASRRQALYPVLSELAPQRQVILFTCHPELAQEAVQGMHAARIDLARSPAARS